MNRVKDSLLLWQEICRNKVLEKVSIVLFLNKCDLLKAKLAAGVQFKKYMTAYEGLNEWAPVATCEFTSRSCPVVRACVAPLFALVAAGPLCSGVKIPLTGPTKRAALPPWMIECLSFVTDAC